MYGNNNYIVEKIIELKNNRNAVILAHNYQRGEIQDIADFVGDSLELSQKAAGTTAEVIVFCGVHFMAETASILCPDKIVLLPDLQAGCPMADMIDEKSLIEEKKKFPESAVVCYVNSSASVKSQSDICCTSSNAKDIVEKVTSDSIIFVPDKYLGHYVSTKTGKKVHLWPGYCPTHARIMPEQIMKLRNQYPGAKVVVHPECRPAVVEMADAVLSTGGMIKYARRDDVEEMIVGTEIGIIHRLEKENPQKRFIPVSEDIRCPNMKLITLEKVLWSLEKLQPQVKVSEDIRIKAKKAIDKMLEFSRK